MPHSIVVIDDHEIAHSALRLLIADRDDLALHKCFRAAKPALAFLQNERPALVILDLDLPDRNGIEVLKEIHEKLAIPVLILSGTTRVGTLQRCRSLGAQAIVSKGDRVEETLVAIDALLDGKSHLSPAIVRLLENSPKEEPVNLSDRQEEILRMVAKGLSNKEIAFQLDISQPTVSFHLRALAEKLGADHPRQLVARARSAGLL